jgi:hypothetical protein
MFCTQLVSRGLTLSSIFIYTDPPFTTTNLSQARRL